jgi:hypothetical protein
VAVVAVPPVVAQNEHVSLGHLNGRDRVIRRLVEIGLGEGFLVPVDNTLPDLDPVAFDGDQAFDEARRVGVDVRRRPEDHDVLRAGSGTE